jgi:hypothetical protein
MLCLRDITLRVDIYVQTESWHQLVIYACRLVRDAHLPISREIHIADNNTRTIDLTILVEGHEPSLGEAQACQLELERHY